MFPAKITLVLVLIVGIFSKSFGDEGVIGSELSLGDPVNLSDDGLGLKIGARASGLCLNEHNAARQSNGKGALQYDTKLEQAAKNHNQAMTSQNCFSHQCSGESGLGERVTKVGYRWSGVAENIAAGQQDCKAAMSSWMNSSGHKANILGNYRHVGCAVQDCPKCTYNKYWTCVFGSPM